MMGSDGTCDVACYHVAVVIIIVNKRFGLYSRKARNDSSGFEHVFVGEVKDGECDVVQYVIILLPGS